MNDILSKLNPSQAEAVRNYESAALIIAGAGSGKTRVLTSRIAYMIQQGVPPESILALTFTNKAAHEMRERIAAITGPSSSRITMGTFHSVFLRILRAEASKIGFTSDFTIYDTSDSLSLLRAIIKEMNLSDEKYKPKSIFARISRLKNELITPGRYPETPLAAEDIAKHVGQFVDVYSRYTERCRANNAMDFDDMLLYMSLLLKNNPDVLAFYQSIFRYILVDEYQDTNFAQYTIVRMLGGAHGNVCVVGDDSQSIYSFRGARIENINGFKRDFPDAKVFKLEQNYRSTKTIVSAANSVIKCNSQNAILKKECFSEGAAGEQIRVIRGYTDIEEAELVVADIRAKAREGASWKDFAILYRVNARSRVIEDSLRRRDVPYKIYHGHSFFDRKEVKDFVAYLRLIVNPRDDEAFKRIVNFPARGIGETSVGKIEAFAKARGMSMWEVLDTMNYEQAADRALAKKVFAFTELIRTLSKKRAELDVYHFGLETATLSGLLAAYKVEDESNGNAAVENIQEVLNSMSVMSEQHNAEAEEGVTPEPLTIEEWLQSVALMTDMDAASEDDDTSDKVTLMTVHSAKGLEFDRVYVVGMEEEQFPGLRAELDGSMEEERRLFYVALTRAKTAAVLSFCTSRFAMGAQMYCHPSRFIKEIDEKYISDRIEGFRSGGAQQSTQKAGSPQGGATFGGFGQRFAQRRDASQHTAPQPAVQRQPTVLDDRFKRVGVRRAETETVQQTAPVESGDYKVGQRVLHSKFGSGTITAVEQMAGGGAGELKISVQFKDPRVGLRTLLSKFAKLQIIPE